MDRCEITYDTCQLGVPSGASKLIYENMVCSMQTVHLSFIKINTISKQTEPSIHLSPSPRSTIKCVQNGFLDYVALGTNYEPILHRN